MKLAGLRLRWRLIALSLLVGLAGCAMDRELAIIRNDQDRMNRQLLQLQVGQELAQKKPPEIIEKELETDRRNIADLKAGVDELRQQVSVLSERIEESGHQLSQRINTLEANLKAGPPQMVPAGGPTPSAGQTSQPPTPAASGGAPEQPPVPPPTAASADAKRVYQAALTDLQRGKWDLAAQGFRAYLAQAPRGDVADTAQYYLAESLYSAKDYRNAIAEFERLVKDFPQSPQVPSAMLKTGYAYYEMKDSPNGRRALRMLIEKYPSSKEAKLAEERLKLEDRVGAGRPTTPPRPPTR